MPPPDPRRWRALAVLSLAQVMVVLDVTIVNVALPDIQADLGFSATGLQWVINAYVLAFGGFLLLGGRAADLLGRRRVFLAGIGLFIAASLVGGLATSGGMLVGARAVQGLGGALLSPAALSLVTATFPSGRERNTALGVWGALAGLGGTVGVVAGGVLVDTLGWQWVLWVNVPIGIAVVPLALRLVADSRADTRTAGRSFDVAGALTITASVLALVYGVIRSGQDGWGSATVIGLLVAAAAGLLAFVRIEQRSPAPLVPLRLFASRSLRAADLAQALVGGTFAAMFFLTALYLQQVLGASALRAGLEFVPMGVAAIAAAVGAPALVERLGVRPVLLMGTSLSVIGLALLTRVGAHADYATDVLPPLLIFGAGIPLCGVPSNIAAMTDAGPDDVGAASGLVTASYQIGGALGLAVATTLAQARVTDALGSGAAQVEALASGFERGITVAAALAAANLVLALVAMPRLRPNAGQVAAAAA